MTGMNTYPLSIDMAPPKLLSVRGDNMVLIYIFNCGCELPTNYKHSFTISQACGIHHLKDLQHAIDSIADWSDVPFVD